MDYKKGFTNTDRESTFAKKPIRMPEFIIIHKRYNLDDTCYPISTSVFHGNPTPFIATHSIEIWIVLCYWCVGAGGSGG